MNSDDGYISREDFYNKIIEHKPKVILMGASAYSRKIDFGMFYVIIQDAVKKINESVGDGEEKYHPYFCVDMAHIAGLVAAGEHPSPFGFADVITTTTHKTLRGPRSGLIFCKPELAKKIDSAVFPGNQGGPLEHIIAAKAICAEEACTEKYRKYIKQVVANTKAMAEEFIKMGYEITTGGTDNHLFMIDFSKTHPSITGRMVQDELDKHNITLNKNCVPNEKRSPKETSGVRIGCAPMTSKGYKEKDFIKVAHKIDKIIRGLSGK
mgnify:FL=1